MKHDIAIIGLGVMGQNLARNLANKGFKVVGWDRHEEKSKAFIQEHQSENLSHCPDFECLAETLESPRKYLMLVPAGEPVDEVIEDLKPFLEKGDLVIDGGNSNYRDTIRREEGLKKLGVHFVGMGVSGGEEGALKGPSLMPGGSKESWKELQPLLEKIAAKDFSGNPCVTHIGDGGAGHYVKMVHNGIEYGVMQLMAEAYQILREAYDMNTHQIGEAFQILSQGPLKSFLFDIAVPILNKKDEFNEGRYLIDYIQDEAGQKGTGQWTAIDALERGVSLPTITMAVFARNISTQKKLRTELSERYEKKELCPVMPKEKFIEVLEQGLHASMISCYAQGFDLMKRAAEEEAWALDFAEIARIWQGGCIIRAELLKHLEESFASAKGKQPHLFSIPEIKNELEGAHKSWHILLNLAVQHDVSVPGISSALMYFEDSTSSKLPANFIQGLRDYFGAHTYERTDREGVFHTEWNEN